GSPADRGAGLPLVPEHPRPGPRRQQDAARACLRPTRLRDCPPGDQLHRRQAAAGSPEGPGRSPAHHDRGTAGHDDPVGTAARSARYHPGASGRARTVQPRRPHRTPEHEHRNLGAGGVPVTDRHLTDADMPLFTQLRMTAFGQTVIDLATDPACHEWTFSEKIFHALDKEITARQERRTQKLLKASRSPNPDACVEEIRYLPDRNVNRELIARLSSCQWIDATRNLVVLGQSSVGKTYLAQALLNAACRKYYTARFFRLDDLANRLAVLEPTSQRRLDFLTDLHNCDLLVLDDFLTTPVAPHTAAELLNILAAREGRG